MGLVVRERLIARRAFGVRLGLEHVARLDRALGEPGREIPIVQVLGTNGKGSTSAMIAALVAQRGHEVGLFTSPHLHRLEERIQLGRTPCTQAELDEALARVLATEQATAPADEPVATFFELLTLAGLLIFAERRCELIVLEAGLGGRLDATSARPARVHVFTRIGLDHQAILGPTVGRIAAEKAAAIRPGAAVVSARQARPAAAELDRRAREVGARLTWARPSPRAPARLLGDHQRENAGLAIEAVAQLTRAGVVGAGRGDDPLAVLDEVHWPGRCERLEVGGREVIFDVAHNPDGCAALAAALGALGVQPDLLVFGCAADKPGAAMLGALEAHGLTWASAWSVAVDGHACPPARTVAAWPDPTDPGLLAAWRRLPGPCRVLVCGSFRVVGPLRAASLGAPVEPDPQDPPRGPA